MKNSKSKSDIIFGAAAGAVLMALVITMVFTLKTGIIGAVLVILIVTVSMLFGWTMGLNQRIERRNWYSYLRGYREGVAKHTTVIEHPMCRCSFVTEGNTEEKAKDSE